METVPLQHFTSLNLSKPLLDAIAEEGYTTLTPIQAQAIAPVLLGRDLLGCAPTGTGKTAAFALPILHRLHGAPADTTRRGPAVPRALVLSPTRELAGQIEDSFSTYGKFTGLRQTVIYGGVSQFHQVKALQRGVDILVATPGRLMDLMEQRLVDLRSVEVFVLDEADRMLDMGFINPIRRIAAALPSKRQTLLFSATMPRSIMHLADSLLRDPVRVSVAPVVTATPLIEQSVYMVGRGTTPALLEHLLGKPGVDRTLVFTRTKHGADKLTRKLNRAGLPALAIHGNKAQNQRQRALDAFRSGRSRVLVATDVAARGIDVDGVSHVFNYDLPNEPEAYVHRIGRTGRAGAKGVAIAFCDHDERVFLRDIEKLTGKKLVPVALPEGVQEAARADSQRTFEDRPEPTHARPRNNGAVSHRGGSSHGRPARGGHAARPSREGRVATAPAAQASHPRRGTRWQGRRTRK